jgi:hypothetical protein
LFRGTLAQAAQPAEARWRLGREADVSDDDTALVDVAGLAVRDEVGVGPGAVVAAGAAGAAEMAGVPEVSEAPGVEAPGVEAPGAAAPRCACSSAAACACCWRCVISASISSSHSLR